MSSVLDVAPSRNLDTFDLLPKKAREYIANAPVQISETEFAERIKQLRFMTPDDDSAVEATIKEYQKLLS